jgi:ABC-type antimicrobial peptide transport system permease subunit
MALNAIRYGIPLVLLIAGVIVSATAGGVGVAAGALFFSAGSAVLLLNVLHRMGVEGDKERDTEESAREFFDQHGRWPDEPESAARARRGA